MKRPFPRLALAALGAAVLAVPLLAAPADVVRTRVAGLRELGAAFKNANDALRGPTPPAIIVQQSAREIRAAANAMPGWFPAGSGPQPGVKTRAKAEIWSQAPRFKASQDAFVAAAASFQRAAAGGNADAMRAEARKLGGTCKACHDGFRVPD